MSNIQNVDIESLVLDHPEVKKKKVGKYAIKIRDGEPLESVSAFFCVHDSRNYLLNGHHRVVATHFSGRKTIQAEVDMCLDYDCDGNNEDVERYSVNDIILE